MKSRNLAEEGIKNSMQTVQNSLPKESVTVDAKVNTFKNAIGEVNLHFIVSGPYSPELRKALAKNN